MSAFVDGWVADQRRRLEESLLGDSSEGRLLGKFCDQLEQDHEAHQSEALSTAQAAEESGYTPQAIRMLRRQGRISERRADLPRKPGHGVARGPQRVGVTETPSIAERVLNRQRRRTG